MEDVIDEDDDVATLVGEDEDVAEGTEDVEAPEDEDGDAMVGRKGTFRLVIRSRAFL